MRTSVAGLLLASLTALAGGSSQELRRLDERTLVADASLLTGHPARHLDGGVHVVVEIPAGTCAKWEVDKRDGALRWELRDGKPRVVQYLGYPGNYGMVPRTLLAADEGGDGAQDDKLIAVVAGSPLATAKDLADLDRRFPGVTTIVATWFANYKGPGEVETLGWSGVERAEALLERAARAFEARR